MTTVSVTNADFVPATLIQSSQLDQNFQDLVSYINGQCIVKDATVAFTGTPSGPSADPVSANQFTRKAYVDLNKPVARQILTSSGSALGAGPVDSDFVLAGVTVDVLRAYEVHLHSRLDFSAPSEWQINFMVDGVATQRLDHKPIIGGDGNNMTSASTIWLPNSGTYTLRVNVTRVSGSGTISFIAAGAAPRAFYVKDIGPR